MPVIRSTGYSGQKTNYKIEINGNKYPSNKETLSTRKYKQVKELRKTIQHLKTEVETNKKLQRETTLEIGNLGKK